MDKRMTETEKAVLDVLESRWKIGRERYGEGISFKQSDKPTVWLENAIEEAADLLQYLVSMKLSMIEIGCKVSSHDSYRNGIIGIIAALVDISEIDAYRLLSLCNEKKNEWYKTGIADYNSVWFCLQTANDFFDFTLPGLKSVSDSMVCKNLGVILDVGAGIGLSTDFIDINFWREKVIYQNIAGRQFDIARKLFKFDMTNIDILTYDLYGPRIDTVFLFEFLEHFEFPGIVLEAIINHTKCKRVIMQNSFGAFGYGHYSEYTLKDKKYSNVGFKIIFDEYLKTISKELSVVGRARIIEI